MNGMAGVMPMGIKHRAVDKSGVPVYQPTNAAAAAASYPQLMQFSQQPFVPVTRESTPRPTRACLSGGCMTSVVVARDAYSRSA